MRIPFGAVTCAWLGLVACGSDSPAGAYLDITNIPASATEIEVVLAGSAQIATGQHTGSGFAAVEDARYYAQRGSTGPIATGGKREMVVLIEPSTANGNLQTELTPIVLARSTAGDDTTLVALATIPGPSDLLTMQLATTTVDEYVATMELAGAIAADAGGLAPSERQTFECANEELSGVAWRAADGSEIRVVRPLKNTAGDAGALPLDLDCDGVAATEGDCDDLASTVHAGAPEQCDGVDSDCGQDPRWAAPCTVTNPVDTCVEPVGRAACDELIPRETACAEIATPVCPGGPGEALSCIVGLANAGGTPCSPDVGQVTLSETICPNGACTVEAPVFQSAGWRATVATDPNGPFGPRAATDNQGRFELLVEQVAGSAGGGPVGLVDLFVTRPGAVAPAYLGVNLETTEEACHPSSGGGPASTFDMHCSQP